MQALQRPHPVRKDCEDETGRAERVRWGLAEKLFALEPLPFARMCLALRGAELPGRAESCGKPPPRLKAIESGPKTSKNFSAIQQRMKRFHDQLRQYLKRPNDDSDRLGGSGRDSLIALMLSVLRVVNTCISTRLKTLKRVLNLKRRH